MVKRVIFGEHHFEKREPFRAGHGLTFTKVAEAFSIALIAYGLGFLLSFLLLRYLTIAQYGDVMVARQALQVVSTILLMGTKSVTRHFLIAYREDEPSMVPYFIWWQVGYLMQTMLLFCVLFSSFFLLFLCLDAWRYLQVAHFHLAFWTLIGSPFYAFFMLLGVYLLAFGHTVVYGFVVQALQSCVWLLLLVVWMYYAPIPSGGDMLSFMLVQSLVLFVVVFVMCLCLLPVRRLFELPREICIREEWGRNRFYALLIDLYSALPVMVLLGVVEFVSHDVHLAGQMSLCVALTVIFYAVSGGIYPLVFHEIQHLVASGHDIEGGRRALAYANRIVLFSYLVLGCVGLFFGREVLAFFGEYEYQTYLMLMVFVVASVGGGLYYPLLNFALIAGGGTRLVGGIDLGVYTGLLFFALLVGFVFGFYWCMCVYGFFMLLQSVIADWYFRKKNGFSLLTLRASSGQSPVSG